MKNTKGFTLIELMITITIATTLLGYALPSLNQLKLNKYMNSERDRLTVSLNFARITAINSQSYVVICPSISGKYCDKNLNWHNGWIVFTDRNRNRTVDNNDEILRHENAMKREIIATSSKYRKIIRYNNMGFSPGTNLSINFCDSRGLASAKSIIINNTGRVKQSKPISDNVCN